MKKGGAGPRRKGDNFERIVVNTLAEQGFLVTRRPRSAFPDIIAIRPDNRQVFLRHETDGTNTVLGDIKQPTVLIIECKLHGKIPKEELNKLAQLQRQGYGTALLASRENGKIVYNRIEERK